MNPFSDSNTTKLPKAILTNFDSSETHNMNFGRIRNPNSFNMILSNVLVGVFELGNSGMKDPPQQINGKLYDSTVDNVNNPTIFVIYRDYRAYPNYIINYS